MTSTPTEAIDMDRDEVDEFPPQVHVAAAIMRLQEALERAKRSSSADSAYMVTAIRAAMDNLVSAMRAIES